MRRFASSHERLGLPPGFVLFYRSLPFAEINFAIILKTKSHAINLYCLVSPSVRYQCSAQGSNAVFLQASWSLSKRPMVRRIIFAASCMQGLHLFGA